MSQPEFIHLADTAGFSASGVFPLLGQYGMGKNYIKKSLSGLGHAYFRFNSGADINIQEQV